VGKKLIEYNKRQRTIPDERLTGGRTDTMSTQRILTFLLVAVLAGCGPTISYDVKVTHDFRVKTDYSKFSSYQWVPLVETVNVEEIKRDTLASLKIAFTDAFEARGYKRVKNNPDFIIALYVMSGGKIISSDWGYNYQWDQRSWGDYQMERRVSVKEVGEGTLVLDILDAGKKELLWSGTASAVLKPGASGADRNKKIDEAVEKLLAKFPPPE